MAKCKIIGGIETRDEKGIDDKILAVLDNKLDKKSKYIDDLKDLNTGLIEEIIYFLNHYKDNEEDKYVEIGEIYNREKAILIVNKYRISKEQNEQLWLE